MGHKVEIEWIEFDYDEYLKNPNEYPNAPPLGEECLIIGLRIYESSKYKVLMGCFYIRTPNQFDWEEEEERNERLMFETEETAYNCPISGEDIKFWAKLPEMPPGE